MVTRSTFSLVVGLALLSLSIVFFQTWKNTRPVFNGEVEVEFVDYRFNEQSVDGSAPLFTLDFVFEDKYGNNYVLQDVTELEANTAHLFTMYQGDVVVLTLKENKVARVLTPRDIRQSMVEDLLDFPPVNPDGPQVARLLFVAGDTTMALGSVTGPVCLMPELTDGIEYCVRVQDLQVFDQAHHGKFETLSLEGSFQVMVAIEQHGVVLPLLVPVDVEKLNPEHFSVVDFTR